MVPRFGRLCALILAAILTAALLPIPAGATELGSQRLVVPYQSQLDGNPYQLADCGPASMTMILAAFDKPVPTKAVRGFVNDLQHTWGMYDSGTFIENLGLAAAFFGLQPQDLFDGTKLRRWTLDDVRHQLDAGHPIVPQVWYRGLPGREKKAYNGDHYIVVTGYDGKDFIYNDPIDNDGPGANRRMSTEQFLLAWRNSDFPFAALAVAGPAGRPAAAVAPPIAIQPVAVPLFANGLRRVLPPSA